MLCRTFCFSLPQAYAQISFSNFTAGFWINLHHFLYDQARQENSRSRSEDASGAANSDWNDSLAFYKNSLVSRDLLFDAGMVFYTSAELVRRDFPDYSPYAYKNGLWQRAWPMYLAALDRDWKPYLVKRVSFDSAVATLGKDVGEPRRP